MPALRQAHRVRLYGIVVAVLTLHATASDAWVVLPPTPAVAAPTLLYDNERGESEALLQYVHLGRFCRSHKQHRLCKQPASLRRFCKEHRRHRLCRDDDEDRFCRYNPRHRRCKDDDDDRFCRQHPKHKLCRDDDDDDRFCRRHPHHRRCDDKPPSPH